MNTVDDDEVNQRREFTITGFGVIELETRQRSDWLQKASVREIPLSECQETFKPIRGLMSLSENILPSQICAKDENKDETADACQGEIISYSQYF